MCDFACNSGKNSAGTIPNQIQKKGLFCNSPMTFHCQNASGEIQNKRARPLIE